jgi:hypothetical protein
MLLMLCVSESDDDAAALRDEVAATDDECGDAGDEAESTCSVLRAKEASSEANMGCRSVIESTQSAWQKWRR